MTPQMFAIMPVAIIAANLIQSLSWMIVCDELHTSDLSTVLGLACCLKLDHMLAGA